MSARLGAVVLLTLAVAAAEPLAAGSRSGHACQPRRDDKIIAVSPRSVIVRETRGAQRGVYWACYHRRNKFFNVGLNAGRAEPARVRAPRLAGRYAGLLQFGQSKSGIAIQAYVFDLQTGRKIHSHHVASTISNFGDLLVDGSDLVLRPTGSVAWIWRISRQAPDGSVRETRYEVHKAEAGDRDVLLDQGPDIEPGSLALSGMTIYWTDAGEARSAALR